MGEWIQPRLGSYELRALTPRVINTQLVQAMRGAAAGEPTVRVALALLQSILRLAVTEERIATNPVGLIKSRRACPMAGWTRSRRRPSRRCAAQRSRAAGRSGWWTRSSSEVLAYAGLRPQELLALNWEDVLGDEAKLFVARKNVDGQLFPYLKSGRKRRNRRHRRVDLFESLAADCARTA